MKTDTMEFISNIKRGHTRHERPMQELLIGTDSKQEAKELADQIKHGFLMWAWDCGFEGRPRIRVFGNKKARYEEVPENRQWFVACRLIATATVINAAHSYFPDIVADNLQPFE